MVPVIELKNLKKYYGNVKGIEKVSFKISSGEIFGFIGPNGAGKSTTIRTIIGLLNKTSGSILINGEEMNHEDVFIKEMIGYLPSEVHLYEDMKVKEILDYHASFYRKDCLSKRKELVKLLKIDESKKLEDLSLGNYKKIGIVLALMHSPKIVILDEPTSGLDPIMQKVLHDILLKEKENGTTILYSSHVLSEVASICDRIAFIKDGNIIIEDTIENIKKYNYTYLKISSEDIKKIRDDLKLEILSETNNEITFINNLAPNELIKRLSNYNLDKLLIENIPLEDLFLKYYK